MSLRSLLFASASVALLQFLAFPATAAPAATAPTTAPAAVSDEELVAELKDPPLESEERGERLIELFRQAGITDIATQDIPGHPGRRNIVATLKGSTDDVIVVTAHFDCSEDGWGVVDDWSGASLMTNLAQALIGRTPRHTFVFVGCDMEEDGLVGSQEYVSSLSPEQRGHVKAAVCLECLGVSPLNVWPKLSADDLEAIAAEVAQKREMQLRPASVPGVRGDVESFTRAGIPAIAFDSLDWMTWGLSAPPIHNNHDNFAAIDPTRFCEHYAYLLAFVMALDTHDGPIPATNADEADLPPRPDSFSIQVNP